MSAVLRGVLGARSLLRGSAITQRAGLVTRPAKDPIGPTETLIGLTAFGIVLFGPAGWVLANIKFYKGDK